MTKKEALDRAKLVLGGTEIEAQEALDLAKELKKSDEFGIAWRVLERAHCQQTHFQQARK